MANHLELKQISKARLKTVKILIAAEDWEGASYMMGYVLECALKSAICKTLNLTTYPEKNGSDKIIKFFKTHDFDVLLTLSGMESIFGFNGPGFASWSGFTQEYPGDWPSMRYIQNTSWDATKTKRVYNYLIDPTNGILKEITRRRRW